MHAVLIIVHLLFGISTALFDHPLDDQKLSYIEKPTEDIVLEWQLVEEIIIFRITAKTKGWVGVGLSREPSMEGSDIILAGIKDGASYVWDAYADRNGPPTVDEDQYVDILSGRENDTHTSVTVVRSLKSLDDKDLSVTNGSYYLLWAFGQSDILQERISFRNYHRGNRGFLPFSYDEEEDTKPKTTRYADTTQQEIEVEGPSFNPIRTRNLIEISTRPNVQIELVTVSTEIITSLAISQNATYASEDTDASSARGSYKYTAALVAIALALILVASKSRLASLRS